MSESPSRKLRYLLLWLALVTALGLLLFTYRHLETVAGGDKQPWQIPLINEMTAALGAGLLFFGVLALVNRYPLEREHWARRLPLYLLGFVVFAFCFTTSNWILRLAVFKLAGLGSYDYGRMPVRYFMEAPMQAISFVVMAGSIHAVRRIRAARARELRTAQLEKSLADARLHGLQLQLQPHFLFNALNTISATMYRDIAAADRMIERLGDLLRRSLDRRPQDEVPLTDELELLDAYLDIMRARFGDRLEVRIDVAPEARPARVPPLLLQPLVENAIRHGGAETRGHGAIEIRAARDGADLELSVTDDGPGPSAAQDGGTGVGLRSTADRLRLLYGDRHRFRAGEADDAGGSGFRVEIRLPFATGEQPHR